MLTATSPVAVTKVWSAPDPWNIGTVELGLARVSSVNEIAATGASARWRPLEEKPGREYTGFCVLNIRGSGRMVIAVPDTRGGSR